MDTIRGVYQKLRGIARYFQPMQIPLHSAYTSFFLILSLFPCMLLLLGLLKYTPLEVSDLESLLEGLLPRALLPVANWVVETSYDHSSGMLVSLSAVAALWSASRGMFGLVTGLNAIYGIRESRSYLHSRSISMVYTLLFLLVLLLTLVLHVFGNALVDYLWMTTRPGLMRLMSFVDLRFVLLLILQTGLFTFMYALLPARRSPLGQSFPGAFLAALGWLGSAKLFSVYVEYFAGYTNIFGSLYGLALGMLWLHFCIQVIFYGAAINGLLRKEKWEF